MKKGIMLVVAFIVWTAMVVMIDVQPLGQNGTNIGFATFNLWFHQLTGVHMTIYNITDWLGLVPIAVGLGFAVLGLVQWVGRKSLFEVDRSILALGVFYIAVVAAYVLFEMVVINYRPILIDGYLEASYPSSTTMLVMCVIPTAMMQLRKRIKSRALWRMVAAVSVAFIAFMVIGRLVSGVHWFTDIVGGMLLSAGLVTVYVGACKAI